MLMPHLIFALLVALLHAPWLQAQAPIDSPVARLVVRPAELSMMAGDTLRLRAEALDAAGRPVPGATYSFAAAGGSFDASVTPDGLVASGNIGTFPVSVTAHVPGSDPFTQRVEIEMLAGPAAYVEITPPVELLAVGQEWSLTATSYSALRDTRRDPISWRSSAPGVIRVDDTGHISAVGAGTATITASAPGAAASLTVRVVGAAIASVELTPEIIEARPGDVIRFKVFPLDATGAAVVGLTPVFSITGGNGVISQDGIFVGYEPGEYRITASYGERSAEAVVILSPRGR